MKNGFEILTTSSIHSDLLEYREKGALRGVYLGFPNLNDFYTISLPGVTDVTGFPGSGKSEFILELLLNTSKFYGWKHLLYVPDVGDKNEIVSLLIHKLTGKTFDKRFQSNYITVEEVNRTVDWITEHFKILYKTDLKAKITPYEFWDYGVALSDEISGGIQTMVIDSWKDLKHDFSSFGREDKYLEDVLSYRNAISEKYKKHLFTIIHPNKTDKGTDGKRLAPTPFDLKGGQEWFNNGKCMITVHRIDGTKNHVEIRVTKAKPKSVANLGVVELMFDIYKNAYYFINDNNEKQYAQKEYIKPAAIKLRDELEDDSEVPF